MTFYTFTDSNKVPVLKKHEDKLNTVLKWLAIPEQFLSDDYNIFFTLNGLRRFYDSSANELAEIDDVTSYLIEEAKYSQDTDKKNIISQTSYRIILKK